MIEAEDWAAVALALRVQRQLEEFGMPPEASATTESALLAAAEACFSENRWLAPTVHEMT